MNDITKKRKKYIKEYQKNWLKKRRQKWIEENGPCKKCGSNKDLEVDHINRSDKTMHTASIWGRREEIRAAELSKCQVLCRKCHIEKTKKELSVSNSEHGTSNMYDHFGCRCSPCREAKRKRSMKRRNPILYNKLYN